MEYKARIGNRTYHFESIKEVMAKANEKKSGDDSERVAAKEVLSELLVSD